MTVSGPANRQHLAGHRDRQRELGPVLRARRVHGRQGRGNEGVVRRQRPVVAGREETENVRRANDQVGQPVPAGVSGRHRVSAVRGTRPRAGGHRHIPWRGVRRRSLSHVPEEGVAQQMGQDPRWRQFLVL